MLTDDESCRQVNKELAEYEKRLQTEAEFLKPYVGALRGQLKEAFPLNVCKDKYMNAVKLDFGHGYDICVYVDKDHPMEYSWEIYEQDDMKDDAAIGSIKNRYYSIFELIKFLNSIKDWL